MVHPKATPPVINNKIIGLYQFFITDEPQSLPRFFLWGMLQKHKLKDCPSHKSCRIIWKKRQLTPIHRQWLNKERQQRRCKRQARTIFPAAFPLHRFSLGGLQERYVGNMLKEFVFPLSYVTWSHTEWVCECDSEEKEEIKIPSS